MSLKRWLYRMLRMSNDIDAVRRGTIGKRLVRRHARKTIRRSTRKFFK